jgi:glycine/D-amino acid oxidase-like deaminating enzyme
MRTYDVIVIGAGITGLSSAYHIKKQNESIRVAILDKKHTFCQGNTAKSSAAFRDLFSSEVNRKIARSSISVYRYVQDKERFDLGMHSSGYLFLGDGRFLANSTIRGFVNEGLAKFVGEESLKQMGFTTRPSEQEISIMNILPIEGGLLGINCGIIAPEKICQYYHIELEKMGVDFFFSTEVRGPKLQPEIPLGYPGEPFLWQNVKLNTIETNKGEFSSSEFIFCTDIWSSALLNGTGIDSHTRGKKRQVFQISGPEVEKLLQRELIEGRGIMPFTILPSHGIALRPDPDSRTIWVTVSDNYNRDFSISDDPQAEPDFYEKSLFPVISAYLPQLQSSKVKSMWAGYYDYNTIDKTHYVFKEKNVIVSTGSSGSGIMKADAVGRVVSSLYAGKDRTILFDGSIINTEDLSVHNRRVEEEIIVI